MYGSNFIKAQYNYFFEVLMLFQHDQHEKCSNSLIGSHLEIRKTDSPLTTNRPYIYKCIFFKMMIYMNTNKIKNLQSPSTSC